MNVVHTTESNLAARLENAGGDLLVLDGPERRFPKYGLSTYFVKSVSTESTIQPTSSVRECIAFELSLIPEVAFVYTAFRSNEVFYVWIVIDAFERAARERIYEKQRMVIDEFPMFQFDFYIIGLMGRNVADLIGDESMQLTYTRGSNAEQSRPSAKG